MLRTLFALSLLMALPAAAHADDAGTVIWTSPAPTGQVTDQNGVAIEDCYATETKIGKHIFYNPMVCNTDHIKIGNYVSMSWTIDEPPINMKGIREAHHVKILPNVWIKLY